MSLKHRSMRTVLIYVSLFLTITNMAVAKTNGDEQVTDIKANSGSRILKSLAAPMYIDPLDEGRAGAMHRGADPHAKLTPEQQISVALQHFNAGRFAQAMVVMNQAITKNPQSAELYNVRASLYLANEDTVAALRDIEQAVKLNPEEPMFRVTRAQIYLKFERLEEARADLDQAISLNPDLIPARFNRGTLLAYEEKYLLALEDFNHCIAVEPHLPAPYFNRGAVYYSLGEKSKAREDIEHFIQMADVPSWKQSGNDLLKAWDAAEKVHPQPSAADIPNEQEQ